MHRHQCLHDRSRRGACSCRASSQSHCGSALLSAMASAPAMCLAGFDGERCPFLAPYRGFGTRRGDGNRIAAPGRPSRAGGERCRTSSSSVVRYREYDLSADVPATGREMCRPGQDRTIAAWADLAMQGLFDRPQRSGAQVGRWATSWAGGTVTAYLI